MNLKKKRILIICSFMLIYMLLSTVIGISSFKPKYGATTATRLNLRESVNGKIISTLDKDTNIKLIGEINNYYISQLKNNQIGLLSKKYVDILDNNLNIGNIFYRYVPYSGYILENNVNLRQGPSTNFKIISKLNKNYKITVIGLINDFNIIILNNKTVGAISKQYVAKSISNNNNNNNNNNNYDISNVDVILTLINKTRKSKGLPSLILNNKLNNIANLKALEMENNDYFLHESPSYGSPFKMMQNFGINYLSAGENIARNVNIISGVNNWINSDTNSKNIFNKDYNNIGIGISKSKKYGYIIVAMFIQK